MLRVLAALASACALLPAQATCLTTRESKPQDWYEWSKVLVAADVTGVGQRGRYDVLTLRVVEIFKGPPGIETVTLEVPTNLWEACQLARPAVGTRVLGALNPNNDANVVPLHAAYADGLRALRPAPIATVVEAPKPEAPPPVPVQCVESPVYGASVKVESCEQAGGGLFLRGEVLRAAQENSVNEVEGLPVPSSGKRFFFYTSGGKCQDYAKNATLTARLSHPCCNANQPYCTRKIDFLIDQGPGAATPLR